MRMSTKGRLAVNALLDLALREAAGPVALASISDRQRVSLSYLEQMFSRLRRAGVVESTRGPGGGYTLGRPAAEISVADVVSAVDEGDAAPERSAEPAAGISRQLWRRLDEVMMEHMSTITLQSLLEQQRAAGVVIAPRPVRRAPALTVVPPSRLPLRCSAPNSVFALAASMAR